MCIFFFFFYTDVFIHNVCSPQAITSAWGTLQTPNFPNPYTSSDDCWCKLSTQLQHRLLLSIIVFQLIPYDRSYFYVHWINQRRLIVALFVILEHCAGAGLYLQSSDEQRSTQCTYLQQGHNYLSHGNTLFINFYSRTPTVRGGFWIIYEGERFLFICKTIEIIDFCIRSEPSNSRSSFTLWLTEEDRCSIIGCFSFHLLLTRFNTIRSWLESFSIQ